MMCENGEPYLSLTVDEKLIEFNKLDESVTKHLLNIVTNSVKRGDKK